jgi:hypothetical protein
MIARARVGVFVAAVSLLAGCAVADGGGRDYNPAHQPGYVAPDRGAQEPGIGGTGLDLPDLGGAAPGKPDNVVRGGDVKAGKPATFELVDGADVVQVSVGDLGDDLVEVATPAESKVVAQVDAKESSVVARLRGTGLGGPALVAVVLSDDVRWKVRLTGGASDQTVDLTRGLGGDVEFVAGTSRAEVLLPAAKGTQRLSLAGGASQLTVRLTGNAPVRVATKDGAGDVTIDGQSRTGMPGNAVFTSPGWDAAPARFDIDAISGVSALEVSRI